MDQTRRRGLMIHIKVVALPICLYREVCNVFRPCTTWVGVATCIYGRDDLYPICSKLQYIAASCSFIPRRNSQLCSAAHWKACFLVYNTAKLGIGSGLCWWFSDNLFSCLVCRSRDPLKKKKYTLSRKKNIIIIGALGNTWDHNGHAELYELCIKRW